MHPSIWIQMSIAHVSFQLRLIEWQPIKRNLHFLEGGKGGGKGGGIKERGQRICGYLEVSNVL